MKLNTSKTLFGCLIVCAMIGWTAGAAQPTDSTQSLPDKSAKPMTINDALAAISQADPIRRAGLRSGLIRQTQRIIPAVVIVRDAASYIDAISSWEGPIRFPILWDDGTLRAREDIARFVREFQPEKVLEFQTENPRELAETREEREKQISGALSRAFADQGRSWQDSFGMLRKQGVFSPGIVVTDASDDAWAGAIALAAGRIEPVLFVENKSTNLKKDMTPAYADELEVQIESAIKTMKFQWEEIGDEIDAITLAMNIPVRVKTGGKARDSFATSDRIGRRDANGVGERWAYAGQIIGNTPSCVYQAMCSLFLELDTAFLWDGYTNKKPWSDYDMTETSQRLGLVGIGAELNDQPRYTLKDWRLRMTRPVDASLILVNSKGSQTRFDLPGGGALPGDIPILQTPSMIHMVHSFSMQTPTDERTIGGRLLSRGVYAYAGSVDEPYLSAFVPTPMIATRIGGSVNFAAAVRYDDGNVWKVAVLGDPLIVGGTAGVRTSVPIMNDRFVDLSERISDRVKVEDFAGAIEDLVILGRDRDAARLSMSLMKNRPSAFTNRCASVAIPALFREGKHEKVIDAFERLSEDDSGILTLQDILWFSGRVLLAGRGNLRIEANLRANLREWQLIGDAEELAMLIKRRSLPDALAMLESFRKDLPSVGQRAKLDRAIEKVKK
jgi:hypothetical protein